MKNSNSLQLRNQQDLGRTKVAEHEVFSQKGQDRPFENTVVGSNILASPYDLMQAENRRQVIIENIKPDRNRCQETGRPVYPDEQKTTALAVDERAIVRSGCRPEWASVRDRGLARGLHVKRFSAL
jgi:hypothetical protein